MPNIELVKDTRGQSHDGVIRIAPAVSEKQNARFSLHATDGFLISAEIESGKAKYIVVKSLHGKRCKVVNPWPEAYLFRKGRKAQLMNNKTIDFETQPDEIVKIVPNVSMIKEWRTVKVGYNANKNSKESASGLVQLGLKRTF